MSRALTAVLLAFGLLAIAPQQGVAAERWQTIPASAPAVPMQREGHADINGASIYYAMTGSGPPVLLLHGGLGSSNDWGNLVPALAAQHTVIVMDSRGQGRSTRDAKPYKFELMAHDVIGLLEQLKIEKVDIVGWSDGANTGLLLAMHHPALVGKLFAFGANTSVSGLIDAPEKNPIFPMVMEHFATGYAALSSTPKDFEALAGQMSSMWAAEPEWTDAQLARITSPVWIVDGDHEEFIKRSHTEHIAATIPGAGLLILPNVSHFAPVQAPELFNAAVLQFLGPD